MSLILFLAIIAYGQAMFMMPYYLEYVGLYDSNVSGMILCASSLGMTGCGFIASIWLSNSENDGVALPTECSPAGHRIFQYAALWHRFASAVCVPGTVCYRMRYRDDAWTDNKYDDTYCPDPQTGDDVWDSRT